MQVPSKARAVRLNLGKDHLSIGEIRRQLDEIRLEATNLKMFCGVIGVIGQIVTASLDGLASWAGWIVNPLGPPFLFGRSPLDKRAHVKHVTQSAENEKE